jgi:methyl-accepting chemotaxis protein
MLKVDPAGNIVAASTVTNEGKPLDTSNMIGRNVDGQPWFDDSSNGKIAAGKSFSSDLVEDPLVAEIYGNRGLTLQFSAPIFDEEGKVAGVWANFASFDRTAGNAIQALRDFYSRINKQVETQVISQKGLLLDDPDPKAVLNFNLLGAGLEAVKQALEGKDGSTQEVHKRRGVMQINGYAASKGYLSYPGHGWAMLVREDMEQARQGARSLRNIILVVGCIVGAGAVFVGLKFGKSTAKQLDDTVGALQAIANGDLAYRMTTDAQDEFGTLATTVNKMAEQLGEAQKTNASQMNAMSQILSRINESAVTLGASAEELTAVSTQMAANAEETSAQANVVSAASEQVSKNVLVVSTGVEEMNSAIREIAKNATEAARVAQQAVLTAEAANTSVSKLGESSTAIGNIVKVITSIAEQTNLLALNATIEAARAGEAGKGFAVVANEVKELAKETARATEDISSKIATIQGDTDGAVDAIQQISQVILQINDISTTIAGAVEEQTATATEMGRNVSEAAKGTAEIAQNITAVAQAAQDTSQGAANSQQASSELSRMASDLQRLGSEHTTDHSLAV